MYTSTKILTFLFWYINYS